METKELISLSKTDVEQQEASLIVQQQELENLLEILESKNLDTN